MILTQEQIEKTLHNALPQLKEEEIQLASRALLSVSSKWKEVDLTEMFGARYSIQCKDICALGEAHTKGCKIRAFVEEA